MYLYRYDDNGAAVMCMLNVLVHSVLNWKNRRRK